jgi:glyoxylase-like metal-dependent hydrolase (beta-lactamase superfamily II)
LIEVKCLIVGDLSTNCYIVVSKGESLVIDPGGEGERILKKIASMNVEVRLVLNTHAHFDHIRANALLIKGLKVPVALHQIEADYIKEPPISTWVFQTSGVEPFEPDMVLKGGEKLSFGDTEASVLATPGHSPGSLSFLIENSLFCGDLLFKGSVGRTDLPGGSINQLMESLRLIAQLPSDLIIYPGHGPSTTLKEELEDNPYLRQALTV